MGVSAQGLLTSNPTPVEVMDFLNSLDHVTEVNITPSGVGFVYINFKWYSETRNLACFYDGDCKNDYRYIWPHNAALVSLSSWGYSDAIITTLVEEFFGFHMLNDCTGDWVKYEGES